MFKKLKSKWGVTNLQLFLILCTFALGGSLSGRIAHMLLNLIAPEMVVLKVGLYLLLVTVFWPLCVLLISIPFGQFGFFRRYLVRLGRRMFTKKNNRQHLSVAA